MPDHDTIETIITAVSDLKKANDAINRERRSEGRLSYSTQLMGYDALARVLALRLPTDYQARVWEADIKVAQVERDDLPSRFCP